MFGILQQYAPAITSRFSRSDGALSETSNPQNAAVDQKNLVNGSAPADAPGSENPETLSGQREAGADGQPKDSVQLSREAEEIRQLQMRDQEVRAHEAAHAAVGGAYAGSPTYKFQRGPDGQSYAVGGEVNISMSKVAGDPQATLQKAQQIRAAALAPAQPSGKDMQIAQRAQAMAAEAQMDVAKESEEKVSSLARGLASGEATVGKEGAEHVEDISAVEPSDTNISTTGVTVSRLDIRV